MMKISHQMHALILGVIIFLAPATARLAEITSEEIECGSMLARDRVPPMDYRTNRKMLGVVEQYHFTPMVEQLIKPMFQYFGSDLNYTLHAYPNHHRALATMIRLGEKEKTDLPQHLGYTIDCFFRRAIRFVPDDVIVRMLYAQYLNKKGRRDDAFRQLDYVNLNAGDNPLTRYNLGLLYFEVGAFDKAVEQAQLSAAMGIERMELKDKLVATGHWREAVAAPAADVAASAASPASGSR